MASLTVIGSSAGSELNHTSVVAIPIRALSDVLSVRNIELEQVVIDLFEL